MIWQVATDLAFTSLENGFILFLLKDEKKDKKHTQWILFLVLLIVIEIMTLLDMGFLAKSVARFLIVVGVGNFIYQCSMFKLLFYVLIDMLALVISEEIIINSWSIFNRPVVDNNLIFEDFIIPVVLMAKALHFLFIVLFKKLTSKNKEDRTFKEIMPILSVGIPFLLVFECMTLIMYNRPTNVERVLYLVCCIAIFCSFIYTLLFLERYLSVQKKAQREEIALQEMLLKHEYYVRRQEDEEKIREIYHDLKNHLLLIKDENVAKQLTGKIESYEAYVSTGNEFLDIVISEKLRLAHENNIQTECNIDFRRGDFIAPLDISTIFGNLMDNAIEASIGVDDADKYIFVNVRAKERFLVIVIKNSMRGVYEPNKQTSKANSSFHGYGLTNVQKSVRKYNGEYNINVSDDEFVISVVLPIPAEKLIIQSCLNMQRYLK